MIKSRKRLRPGEIRTQEFKPCNATWSSQCGLKIWCQNSQQPKQKSYSNYYKIHRKKSSYSVGSVSWLKTERTFLLCLIVAISWEICQIIVTLVSSVSLLSALPPYCFKTSDTTLIWKNTALERNPHLCTFKGIVAKKQMFIIKECINKLYNTMNMAISWNKWISSTSSQPWSHQKYWILKSKLEYDTYTLSPSNMVTIDTYN